MLDLDSITAFPSNVVDLLEMAVQDIDPHTPGEQDGLRIRKRPLQITDDTQSIGIFPQTWTPIVASKEMMGGRNEPTLQTYTVLIQVMVKDMEEDQGIRHHSALSGLIRNFINRDPALRQALPALKLSFTIAGAPHTEKLAKWDVVRQQFMNSETPNGLFIFLSTIEFEFVTEFE